MILGDSGYFVALLDPGDDLHERAIRWSRYLTEPLLVTEYVLIETFSFFSAPRNRFLASRLAGSTPKRSQF